MKRQYEIHLTPGSFALEAQHPQIEGSMALVEMRAKEEGLKFPPKVFSRDSKDYMHTLHGANLVLIAAKMGWNDANFIFNSPPSCRNVRRLTKDTAYWVKRENEGQPAVLGLTLFGEFPNEIRGKIDKIKETLKGYKPTVKSPTPVAMRG